MLDRLSRSELLHLMQMAGRCLAVTSIEQLETIISSIYDVAEFRKAALCALSGSGSESEVSLTHYVNHSYGAQWAELYAGQNFHRIDPVLLHASATDGVFRWQDAQVSVAREGAAFLDAAETFGLVEGLSFSCARGPQTFRSVLSMTGVPSAEFERASQILAVIGPHLHESYRRVLELHPELTPSLEIVPPQPLIQPEPSPAVGAPAPPERTPSGAAVELSAREREVLCWAQQGKTYWEIGCILGISQRTVKFHIQRIKAKLDVVSTAHAIAKAMRTGIIT
jgi:DNA-binding CsgD family transcriptional regulator